MTKYINANMLVQDIEQSRTNNNHNNAIASQTHNAEHRHFIKMVLDQPAADVVPKGLYEQIKFERDIAMEQLQENGIAFGAEVQRSRWLFVCVHANRLDYECENCRNHIQTINEPDYILAYKRCPNCGAIMEAYKKRI